MENAKEQLSCNLRPLKLRIVARKPCTKLASVNMQQMHAAVRLCLQRSMPG